MSRKFHFIFESQVSFGRPLGRVHSSSTYAKASFAEVCSGKRSACLSRAFFKSVTPGKIAPVGQMPSPVVRAKGDFH